MSFILDALKKSESDRQRQSGPALFEVKVAPPKSRFPVWAIAIVALLVVNMIIVGWMLLRRASHGEETAATSATTPAAGTEAALAGNNTTAAVVAPPINAGAQSSAPPVNGTAYNSAPYNGTLPNSGAPGGPGTMTPTSAPPSSAPAAQQQSWPPSNQQGMGAAQTRMPERDQNEPTLGANNTTLATPTGNAGEAGGANTDPAANPDDYAPAADPGSALFKGHVKRGTESGLVLYQDAALVPGANLPQLRLDLHVYAAKPQDRFALINMHKMHEGDSLQGGVRVDSITPDGVVMSHNGSKFLLPRE
jgi:general secretion pathway protein B